MRAAISLVLALALAGCAGTCVKFKAKIFDQKASVQVCRYAETAPPDAGLVDVSGIIPDAGADAGE